ncbi:MAG: GNAT family N-acetyltransferase [Paracoccus sp. (in: a-proteobacteria)]|uniref:GNAT family N-acetyltransferase n=1 Tax=Paracoccus sp. TaxID=267 RepID=UPI0026E0450D|nr:GNAT family N-acetyltransferase [Paracoccus sp. (in: a-proteobacteria)]MDO5611639.1 GNAT family N-acetyltransferase [Paracoccus sp. (in: a-proteobacteria)]
MDTALAAAFDATWPAAEYARAGGFSVGRGMGGGGRVGSARATGPWTGDDITAAIQVQQGWDQPPQFRVGDDDQALAQALAARGLRRHTPTLILAAPVAALTGLAIPSVTTFTVWPPMAIQREIWSAGGIGPARRAIMQRAPQPKTAILGRTEDRAAGAAFAAVSDGVAMVHAVEVLPGLRRKGLAGWMMRQAAIWGTQQGASRIALAVGSGNGAALALYRGLGFAPAGGYAYWQAD